MTAKDPREKRRPSSRRGQPLDPTRVAARGGRDSLREAADSESGRTFARSLAPLCMRMSNADARGAHWREGEDAAPAGSSFRVVDDDDGAHR